MPEGEIKGERGAFFSGDATNMRKMGLLEDLSFIRE